MTLSRRNLLLSGGAALALGSLAPRLARRSRAESPTVARNLIIVLASGGWDVTYSIDPKPGSEFVDEPAGTVQLFGDSPILTDPTRSGIEAFFAEYGAITAVVNGINVRSIAHPECLERVLTGTSSSANPDLGAIAGHELAAELPVPYLVLGNVAFTGPLAASAGRIGNTNQIKALLDPADAYVSPPGSPYAHEPYVPTGDEEALIRQFVQARTERERATRGQRGSNRARIDDFTASLERGDRLREFSDELGPRGVTLQFANQLALATDAIARDISHAVMVDTRLPWDTHANNVRQGMLHDQLFAGLDVLVGDLATRPGRSAGKAMLDETVVVVMSEMSRTPRINAGDGKDHWPVTSALVIGAGVAGGRTYGGTDDSQVAVAVDFASGSPAAGGQQLMNDHIAAGVLALLGIDSSKYLPATEAFDAFCA